MFKGLTDDDKKFLVSLFQQESKTAIKSFFKSSEGRELLGGLVYDSVSQAINNEMIKEIEVEDGKSEPGRPPMRIKKKIHVIEFLARYLPDIEGRLLGVQSDAAQARNRATEVKTVLVEVMKQQAEIIDLPPASAPGRLLNGN